MGIRLKVFVFAIMVVACVPENDIDDKKYYLDLVSVSFDQTPSVSPDGKLIAYYHKSLEMPESPDYPTGLYVVGINGDNRKLLIKGDHLDPSWSPDCKSIIFSSMGVLRILNLENGSINEFEGVMDLPLYCPDWSSTGDSIVFSAPLTLDGGVYIMDSKFNTVRRLLNPIDNNGMYAKFSPNSDSVVYIRKDQSFSSVEVFKLALLSLEEERLTFDDNQDQDVDWLPNGRGFILTSDMEIILMDSQGHGREFVSYGRYPAIDPSGNEVVFSYANEDCTKEVLWKTSLITNEIFQLTF